MVDLWPLLIKDVLPIATKSRQPSSKPYVSGWRFDEAFPPNPLCHLYALVVSTSFLELCQRHKEFRQVRQSRRLLCQCQSQDLLPKAWRLYNFEWSTSNKYWPLVYVKRTQYYECPALG